MATEEKAKDLRSAADIAMTRHVDNFEIPVVDPDSTGTQEFAEEIRAELAALKLPKTAKAAHQLLQEILAIEPESQKAEIVKRAKLSMVRAHLSELEQGPPTPVLSMAAHKEISGVQSEHANLLHLLELAKGHPEVKALMTERDALAKANAECRMQNEELVKANAALVQEITALKAKTPAGK